MHVYNSKNQRIDLIVREQSVYLYYMQYPAIKIDKKVLIDNLKCKMNICIDMESGTVQYKAPRIKTEAIFVLCTELSYTDSEEYGTMTLFKFPFKKELTDDL